LYWWVLIVHKMQIFKNHKKTITWHHNGVERAAVEFVCGSDSSELYLQEMQVPYFSGDNAHLMYNAHRKLFRHPLRCIDTAHLMYNAHPKLFLYSF
jgi:hypothetical protein